MTPSGEAATSPVARVWCVTAADPAARLRLPWAEAIADAPDVALLGDLAV